MYYIHSEALKHLSLDQYLTTHLRTLLSHFSSLSTRTMVLAKENDNLVYGLKLSSVGAGQVAGQNMLHDPSSFDLAMKLHYLRGLYFFTSQAAEGLEVTKIKEAMFDWLCTHYRALGRFRRSESSGRPYLKCNDCGARFIEAQSDKTMEEWMGMDWSLQKQLVSNQIIGPELFFSPVVLFQLTRFKCGGVSLGLSWAHVLGDAMAATDFINGLSRVMAAEESPRQPYSSKIQAQKLKHPSPLLALKKVGSVGDHWITPNNHKMETFSFSITPTQLNNLKLKLSGQNPDEKIPIFELVCGLMWHCVAKVRQGSEPKVVTVCRNDTPKRARGECSNSQVISTVETAEVADTDPKELAALLAKHDESYEQSHFGEEVDKDNGVSDFVVYGGNLTFVNWEDIEFYGFEVDEHKAVSVNYNIQGVGDEGAVLVLPGPSGEGRVVNVTLPEKEVLELKAELRKNDLLQED